MERQKDYSKEIITTRNKWVLAISIIILPVILNYLIIGNSFPSKGSNDGWLSFFGSYLGAITGGLITLFVLLQTLKYSKLLHDEVLEKNEKIHQESMCLLREQEANSKRLQVQPYLSLLSYPVEISNRNEKSPQYDIEVIFSDHLVFDTTELVEIIGLFGIKNVGAGNAINWMLDFQNSSLGELGIKRASIYDIENGYNPAALHCIKDEETYFRCRIKADFKNIHYTDLTLCIGYRDIIGTEYIQKFKIRFHEAIITGSGLMILDVKDPEMRYATNT